MIGHTKGNTKNNRKKIKSHQIEQLKKIVDHLEEQARQHGLRGKVSEEHADDSNEEESFDDDSVDFGLSDSDSDLSDLGNLPGKKPKK